MNEVLIAFIGMVGGGIGLYVLQVFFIPKRIQVDTATQLREELREDIKGYKQEVKDLRTELNEWQVRYFQLIEILIDNNIEIPIHLKDPIKWENKK